MAWLQNLPDPPETLTLEELRRGVLCFLIPETDSEEEAIALISKHYKKIFENELLAWHTIEHDWPKKRILAMFQAWFDLEYHSEVIDLMDIPIEKENVLS